jgi:hypothetical protein
MLYNIRGIYSILFVILQVIQTLEQCHRITGFFFRMSTQVKAEVRRTKAVTWVRMRKKKPVISNTGNFFCFNNNVYQYEPLLLFQ